MSKENLTIKCSDVKPQSERRRFFKTLAIGMGTITVSHSAIANPRAINGMLAVLLSDPEPEPTLPEVITDSVIDILSFSARVIGNVVDDGDSDIIERGVVFATTELPTILTGTKVIDASVGEGSYTVDLTGLSAATNYFARAYAINTTGISYGDQVSFVTLNID